MSKVKDAKRQMVNTLGSLQAAIAEADGSQKTALLMVAASLEGVYKALLFVDGDVIPASQLAKKPKKPQKQSYGKLQLVMLTEDEHKKLVSEYGEKVVNDYIDKLDLYVGSKGAKYSSHYATIINWLTRDGVAKSTKSKVDRDANNFMDDYLARYMEDEV